MARRATAAFETISKAPSTRASQPSPAVSSSVPAWFDRSVVAGSRVSVTVPAGAFAATVSQRLSTASPGGTASSVNGIGAEVSSKGAK